MPAARGLFQVGLVGVGLGPGLFVASVALSLQPSLFPDAGPVMPFSAMAAACGILCANLVHRVQIVNAGVLIVPDTLAE
jgi:hypothetical protein